MTAAFPRELLQPALLDRLDDDLGSTLDEVAAKRRMLERRLDEEGRAAFAALLADPRLPQRPLRPEELRLPEGSDVELRALAARVVELEQARRSGLRRGQSVTMRQLRASVLRELGNLLNTESPETLRVREGDGEVPLFAGCPQAAASVLNYGIPPLAGRVRTGSDLVELARAVADAIRRFEPRLRDVRVGLGENPPKPADLVHSPVTLLIDAELWGYPLGETLHLRTVLDLEEGTARVTGTGPGEAV